MKQGLKKAAMLLMAVNKDIATKIFSMLEDDEIKEISQAMSSLGVVEPEAIETLVLEFSNEVNETVSLVGNLNNTERLLRKILDKDKVDNILEDIRGPAGKNIWDKLGNVSEDILFNFLKNEYPQTTALILSKLNPVQSSKVISLFQPEFAFDVINRMLNMDSVRKEVLDNVERVLRSEFISNIAKTQKYDNNEVMAEIFNNFDRNTEAKFMKMLEVHDDNTAEKIKKLMFTFSDIQNINSTGIQTILKVVDKVKLILALKGSTEEIRALFFNNMSQRAAKIMKEEIETMGPVKLKDVDEAQNEVINTVKELIAKEEIEVASGDDEDQLVY